MSLVRRSILVVMLAACGGTNSGDGAEVFRSICSNCHGPDGVPPQEQVVRIHPRNLTSPEFRAHVTPALVEKQVRYGSQNKLMPAFQGVLREDQIMAVSAYVAERFHP
jgi:mono/diheme cytochrome c family protein